MKRYYKVRIAKQRIGSAVRHKMPPVQGEITTDVPDYATRGDYVLLVVDCDDAQHKENLSFVGVTEIPETDAAVLGKQYRPERTQIEVDLRSGKERKIHIPGFDLIKVRAEPK